MQDLFPVLGFVLAYVLARMCGYTAEAIYIATAVLMAVTIVQITWMKVTRRTIEKRHWLTLSVVLVLGAITLAVHDDRFIKLKPTVLNTLLAAVFFGSQFIAKDNLTKKMFHGVFDMPEQLWRRLNFAWVIFFLGEGALNAIVALRVSNDVYVAFKFWGLMILTFLFLIIQFILLHKYLRQTARIDGEAKHDE